MRVREACSCGAQIEVDSIPKEAAGMLVTWRTEHRHDLPPSVIDFGGFDIDLQRLLAEGREKDGE